MILFHNVTPPPERRRRLATLVASAVLAESGDEDPEQHTSSAASAFIDIDAGEGATTQQLFRYALSEEGSSLRELLADEAVVQADVSKRSSRAGGVSGARQRVSRLFQGAPSRAFVALQSTYRPNGRLRKRDLE